jgi:hypothetical protein
MDEVRAKMIINARRRRRFSIVGWLALTAAGLMFLATAMGTERWEKIVAGAITAACGIGATLVHPIMANWQASRRKR